MTRGAILVTALVAAALLAAPGGGCLQDGWHTELVEETLVQDGSDAAAAAQDASAGSISSEAAAMPALFAPRTVPVPSLETQSDRLRTGISPHPYHPPRVLSDNPRASV